MTMREVRCPSCGAPMGPQAFTGAHVTCRFCGAGIVVAPAVATAAAITVDRVGQPTIEVIKQVRRFSGLGLAEAKTALETPRALIPIEARNAHEEIRRRFAALGYVVSFAPSGG